MSEAAIMDDGLPMVGEDRGNRALWIGLGTIGIAGVLLFAVLENSRRSPDAPNVPSPQDYAIASAPRPDLYIPEDYGAAGSPVGFAPTSNQTGLANAEGAQRLPPVRLAPTFDESMARPPSPAPEPSYFPPPMPVPAPAPDPGRAAPVIVYDIAVALAALATGGEAAPQAIRSVPAMASAAVDRYNLVAQGTLIYAVLETALDSTQSGQVRAMISTNVYNASGTKILIPKGSRVFGEYKSDLGSGQNRAQIIWGRLIRPDGVTISLDSPASDQLGRAGVKGKVDTHFGERLLGALLQSSIDFGTYAASRAVTTNNGVVVALPVATQSAGSQIIQPAPKPTLRVKHGTRIAVFVARDLDFSAVE